MIDAVIDKLTNSIEEVATGRKAERQAGLFDLRVLTLFHFPFPFPDEVGER